LNKNKPIWDIVNLETNQTRNTENINNLNIGRNLISNHQQIAHACSKYILTVGKSINTTQN
jgi:hypothetical protein